MKSKIQSRPRSTPLHAILTSIVTTLVIWLLLIACLVAVPKPTILGFFGYKDLFVVANPESINTPHTQRMVGELVKNGTILNIQKYWDFQSGFYEAIMAILVGINALIATAAVFYIRGSSHEKAEDTADSYLKGESFRAILEKLVTNRAKEELASAQSDYNELANKLDICLDRIADSDHLNERCTNDIIDIRQQLRVIAEKISLADTGDNDGTDLQLIPEE